MKVLLINPPYPKGAVGFRHLMALEPLALEYVGAILQEENHKVKILDAVVEDNIGAVLKEFHPDIVSCTCYFMHLCVIEEMFREIKRFDSSIVTIVAGSHATQFPEDFYMDDVDVVNAGEDFLLVSKLVKGIETGRMEGIEGVHYRTKPDGKSDPGHEMFQLMNCRSLDRSLTKKYHGDYYWYFEKNVASVWGSVGCPFMLLLYTVDEK